MGLLDGKTQLNYYQGNDLGNYQFTSLDDIISQFQIAYVGEGKIIPKIKRADIAFHAQRALQELSFDTFKSVKAQEIVLPPSLSMILPHDYVNYTKVSWVDSAGIKHPLYKTNSTSNPFSIKQTENKEYDFSSEATNFLTNYDFTSTSGIGEGESGDASWKTTATSDNQLQTDSISVSNSNLTFKHGSRNRTTGPTSNIYCAWQKINLIGVDSISFSATAAVAAESLGVKGKGRVRIGITSLTPTSSGSNITSSSFVFTRANPDYPFGTPPGNPLVNPDIFTYLTTSSQPAFIDFDQTSLTTKTIDLDLSSVEADANGDKFAYVIITSTVDSFQTVTTDEADLSTNLIGDVTIIGDSLLPNLSQNLESTAWANYKSTTPSENNNDDYEDDTYWPMRGNRYGLDPQHAQANGSFYIDNRLGKINFSSNISGKTVILDYISDSLGTDAEMQVHKFAEEAMYKCIAYAILSTTVYGQQLVPRFKKEKFAEVRKAKLRLSSLKLEELTQILRGKSKWIKH